MKNRKIKKSVWITVAGIILVIVLAIFGFRYLQYRNSTPYKLKQIGYPKEEIQQIEKLNQKQIEVLLKKDYDSNIVKFMKDKYFIFENLDRYLAYQKENKNSKIRHTVAVVNVNADYEFYDEEAITKTKTDLKDPYLILVNKYHYLDQNFKPDDLVDVSIQYAYGENEIRKEVYQKFRSMFLAAFKEDLKLIITSSYREYEYQEKLWNSYSNQKGEEWADSVAARPGFSEHQTGLSLDIVTDGEGSSMDKFETTDEFAWLSKNAYKYGFILRYPKDKEDITGYAYESWHYRYVGEKVAKEIHDANITYDEYYAYNKSKIEG